MRLLLVQLWPVWLVLGITIAIILIINNKQRSEDTSPRIIGFSRAGFLITCLIFVSIITGFIWLGSKLEKDTSHDYSPARIEGNQLTQGRIE